jgi:hypothetical protein
VQENKLLINARRHITTKLTNKQTANNDEKTDYEDAVILTILSLSLLLLILLKSTIHKQIKRNKTPNQPKND